MECLVPSEHESSGGTNTGAAVAQLRPRTRLLNEHVHAPFRLTTMPNSQSHAHAMQDTTASISCRRGNSCPQCDASCEESESYVRVYNGTEVKSMTCRNGSKTDNLYKRPEIIYRLDDSLVSVSSFIDSYKHYSKGFSSLSFGKIRATKHSSYINVSCSRPSRPLQESSPLTKIRCCMDNTPPISRKPFKSRGMSFRKSTIPQDSIPSTRRSLGGPGSMGLLLLLVQGLAVCVSGLPVHTAKDNTISLSRERREYIGDNTQRYLMQYGYLPMSDMETGNLRTEDQLRDAIRTMQHFGHIPVTGRLDTATKELMKRPRCSLPDLLPEDYGSPTPHFRTKRFVKQGSRWSRTNLTWGIATYPTQMRDKSGNVDHLSSWEIQREFRLATEVWGRASRLIFIELEKSPQAADIIIEFKNGYHGDGYPFDGQGRTLAHAFYPGSGIGGDMHFDDEEPWVQHKDSSNSSWDRVSLFITAAHELGHALGLYHSDVEGALMSPYLIKFPPSFVLPEDDVRGIQELYGVNKEWTHKSPPPPPPPTIAPRPKPKTPKPKKPILPPKPDGKPDTCNTEYDAISVIRREIYVFKGKYFWRMDAIGRLKPNYPADISRFWTGLPDNLTHIDAVYERPHDANIVFFIGKTYYLCEGNRKLVTSGPLTDLGLPEDLDKVDAAFVWGHNGRTYLFANTMYWRFDESIQHVELDYPRDMVMWSGVPYNVDSAFKYNGTTYFFKGPVFYEFDDLRMKAVPKSPQLSAPYWLGCPNNIENPNFPDLANKQVSDAAPRLFYNTLSVLTTTILLLHIMIL